MSGESKIDKISRLALRRGFFFPSCEIYSDAAAGFWDYGPLGAALKRRIIGFWRKRIVMRDGMLEIDGSQIMPESVFKASGHLRSFIDPLTDCKKCGKIFRADRLIQSKTEKLVPEALPPEELDSMIREIEVKCPECNGELSKVVQFNLMFRFGVGPKQDNKVGLRPETCQSIFLDFARVYNTMRARLPIGIAQVGKAFRNEISPRRGLIRLREFTQAEIEVFFNPDKLASFRKMDGVKEESLVLLMKDGEETELTAEDAVKRGVFKNELVAYYLVLLKQYYEGLGIDPHSIRLRELLDDERPFYAQSAWDLEVKTSFGWLEAVANHYRTDYDLTVHSDGSRKDLRVLDDGERILPWIWENSMGIDRTLLIVLDSAYCEEGKRVYLKLPGYLAPIQAAVFPLVDRDGLTEKAEQVYEMLKEDFNVVLDVKDSIGRRYYRVDEVGVPHAVTIDYDTLKDDTVTVRDRDSTQQIRVKIGGLKELLKETLKTP